jgi:predicted PolB exonuclease-like 3'-5' exonuclease
VFLRVQQLRGTLDAGTVAARLAELKFGESDPGLAELARGATLSTLGPRSTGSGRTELARAAESVRTELDGLRPGLLAFDIETRLDLESLSRAVGRTVTGETSSDALLELGSSGDFAPAPFHQVLAVALVHLDGQTGQVGLERLRVGGRTLAGGTIATEADLLATFWRLGARQRLASYNGKRFDLPVLLYRSLAHGLDASWYLADARPAYEQYRHRSSTRQLDLFDRLTGGLSPGRLGDLLQTIGLPGKQDVQGSDVEALWESGREEAVADYCLSDAAQTFLLALRFLQITGELDPAAASAAVAAARARFEKEPALRPVVEAGVDFFASYRSASS